MSAILAPSGAGALVNFWSCVGRASGVARGLQTARSVRSDPLLIFGLCVLFGAAWVSAPIPSSLVLLLLVGLFWERFSRLVLAVGLLLLAASAWRAWQQVNTFRDYQRTATERLHQPERCAVRARVTSSPSVRAGKVRFDAEVQSGECESFVLSTGERLRLSADGAEAQHLVRGSEIDGVAQLSVLGLLRNRELPDPTIRAARSGIAFRGTLLAFDVSSDGRGLAAWIDRARAHARLRIEATFVPQARGMAKALVLGENDLDDTESDAFKASGLAHLLAVSGTHLVFAVVSLVGALRFLLVRVAAVAERYDVGRVAAWLGASLALLYADFAGGSGSAWRAAWMLAAAFIARGLWREANVARAVGASLVVGWLNDALALFDISFMLSLAATFGLLTFGRWGGKLFCDYNLPRPLRLALDGLIATLSSMLPCSVPLASLGPNVSLMGIVANVLAAPFGETVALPLCLLHPLFSWWPLLEAGLARVASGALLVVRQVALLVGNSTWLRLDVPYPTDWEIAVLLFATLSALQLRGEPAAARAAPLGFHPGSRFLLRARWISANPKALVPAFAFVALAALELASHSGGHPRGQLRVTILDVGQGDAALIDLPDGRLMLVDAGGAVGAGIDPGERVIAPLLRARRREHIDLVVMSHPHPDHYGGLAAVLRATHVKELWDTGQGELEGAGTEYRDLLAEARRQGVVIRRPQAVCGLREYGGLQLRVLGPCPAFTPEINANDNSFVINLRFGTRSVLLVGDAEAAQEAGLLRDSYSELSADLLKVGHHGSRTSSGKAFVRAVAPSLATISCGQGNRFGHPHPEVLSELRAAGISTLRTDHAGSVTWVTDGKRVNVRTFQE